MLTNSFMSLVTEYFRHTNVTGQLAAVSPLGFSLHIGDWWWADCGLASLAHEGALWSLLFYLVGALLLFLAYRAAFSPVDRVKVSAGRCPRVCVLCGPAGAWPAGFFRNRLVGGSSWKYSNT